MPKQSHEVWSEATFSTTEGGNIASQQHKFTTSSNEELFPIACVLCRKLHKRCDKKLPSCSKCIAKGLTCTYQEPKKKGRTKGSKNHVEPSHSSCKNQSSNERSESSSGDNTPSPNNSNENIASSSPMENIPQQTVLHNSSVKTPYGTNLVNISNNLNVMNPITSVENVLSQTPSFLRTMRMNLIDAYYDIVSLGYPLIERSELERYMFSQDELNDRKEILAFVLSIQGMCQQRFGYSDLATDSIEKSSLVLKECFDGYSDFYIAATYSNFAYYYIGEGDTKKSRFYNHFVEFYLKELDELSTVYQQNLRWIKILVDYLGNPRFPYLSPNDLIGFFKTVIDKEMPSEWKEALYDFSGINISNCEERLAIYNSISDSMQNMRRGSLVSSIIYDVIYGVLRTGLSISIYSFVDMIHFRQTVFDLIIKMFNISDNEYFSFIPPIVIPYMIVSAKILMEMEKVIATGELNTNGIDYYSLLLKCNRALNILSKRYRAISVLYSDILQQLNTILSNRYQNYEEIIPLTIPQTKSKISRLVEFDSEIKKFFLPLVHPLIEHNMLSPKPLVSFCALELPSHNQSNDNSLSSQTSHSPNPFLENETTFSFYQDPLLTDEIIACLEGLQEDENFSDEFL